LLLLFAVIAAGGYFGYLELTAEKERAAATQRQLHQATIQNNEYAERQDELEAKLVSLEMEKSQLWAERDALAQAVTQKDAELAELKATHDDLQEKMKKEIASGQIRLSQSHGRVQVDLVDQILFESGQADLSDNGKDVLARVGAVLAKIQGRTIQVSGHTDDAQPSDRLANTFPTNWELSAARAVNVVRYLTEEARVPSRRLVAAGYGQFQPVANNASAQGRARNRRIEILLTPALAPGQKSSVAQSLPAKVPALAKPAATASKPAKAAAPAPAKPKAGPLKKTASR
jgi:chemotaxis protein MotB